LKHPSDGGGLVSLAQKGEIIGFGDDGAGRGQFTSLDSLPKYFPVLHNSDNRYQLMIKKNELNKNHNIPKLNYITKI